MLPLLSFWILCCLQTLRLGDAVPSTLTPKYIFDVPFGRTRRASFELAGDKNEASCVVDSKACENGWLIFTLCAAWGLCCGAFPLSESGWITPLCTATRGQGEEGRGGWRTQKEMGSGSSNQSKLRLCIFVSYLGLFSFNQGLYNTKYKKRRSISEKA